MGGPQGFSISTLFLFYKAVEILNQVQDDNFY